MTQLLINYVNIAPTTILIRPGVSVSCPLLIVRLAAYISNLSEFYSYRLIGKLTAFLQLQELCLHNQIVDFSTTSARLLRQTWREVDVRCQTSVPPPWDRDEVNRREVSECDGWVCDFEVIGVPSRLIYIRIKKTIVEGRKSHLWRWVVWFHPSSEGRRYNELQCPIPRKLWWVETLFCLLWIKKGVLEVIGAPSILKYNLCNGWRYTVRETKNRQRVKTLRSRQIIKTLSLFIMNQ